MLKRLTAVASLAAVFSLFALAVAAAPPQDARNSNRARPAPSTEIPPAPELPPAVSPDGPYAGVGTGPGTIPSRGVGVGTGEPGRGYGPGRGEDIGGGGPGTGGGEVDYDRPFTTREVTSKAVIISKPEPGFTEEARENDTEGFVRLRAVLWKDGAVKNISVIKGLPDGLTDKAVAAARQIRFRPARKDGRDVSQYVVLEYNFNIYYDDDKVERKAVILEQPAAEYTEEARRNRTEGKVVLEVMLYKYGRAETQRVLVDLPHGLTLQARAAVSRIRFTPAEDKGRKVSVVRRVEYVFSLD